MPPSNRRLLRWTSGFLFTLLAAVVLWVAILAYPSPLFSHDRAYGTYRVYSDEAIPVDFDRVIADLDRRLQGMEHAPPEASQRIYLCNAGRYAFFAFLAHEIAHFNSVRALGFRAHLGQPLWKSEGWAEYQANLSAIRADPDYDLAHRVDLLLDGSHWGGRGGAARFQWESQLLVEFLGEVKGYGLEDLVKDEVTQSSTREQMMAWYRNARDSRPVGHLRRDDQRTVALSRCLRQAPGDTPASFLNARPKAASDS